MSILAKNVRLIRKELRCTQSAMAEILKIGFRTYVRYEAGERDAPVSVLIKLAHLGNISLEQLLTQVISNHDISPASKICFESLSSFEKSPAYSDPNETIIAPVKVAKSTIN